MTITTTERSSTEVFFRISSDLTAAIAAQNMGEAVLILNEVLGAYACEPNPKLRARYGAILERHNLSERMAEMAV